MQGDIVAQGVELMLFGMGTVVVFLALLVVATTAMSRIVARHFPEPEPPADKTPQRLRGSVAQLPPEQDPNLVAVITAAIHRYRARRK